MDNQKEDKITQDLETLEKQYNNNRIKEFSIYIGTIIVIGIVALLSQPLNYFSVSILILCVLMVYGRFVYMLRYYKNKYENDKLILVTKEVLKYNAK